MLILKILIGALLLIHSRVSGQIYIGVTGDLGNRVHYSTAKSFFKRPLAPSASLVLAVKENLRNNFLLEYSFSLSALGYIVKPAEVDSLTVNPGMYFPDWNYNNLFINGCITIGKQFHFVQRPASLNFGGGFSYFFDTFGDGVISTWYTWDGKAFEKVFEYETQLDQPTLKGIAQISGQINVTRSLVLGIRLIHQFKPALTGTYQFYHLANPPKGDLRVAQRSVSILLLYRISGKNT